MGDGEGMEAPCVLSLCPLSGSFLLLVVGPPLVRFVLASSCETVVWGLTQIIPPTRVTCLAQIETSSVSERQASIYIRSYDTQNSSDITDKQQKNRNIHDVLFNLVIHSMQRQKET